MDDALVNDYLADLCEGKVNNWLIDYVDELYEEMEDIKIKRELVSFTYSENCKFKSTHLCEPSCVISISFSMV